MTELAPKKLTRSYFVLFAFALVLYTITCVPFGEFGYRVNLISAVCGAVTVANIFLLVRIFASRPVPAIADVRNDVKVISRHGDYKNPIDFVTVQTLDKLLAEGAVCVVSPQEGYCPKFILDNKKYRFVESGPIHRVEASSNGSYTDHD